MPPNPKEALIFEALTQNEFMKIPKVVNIADLKILHWCINTQINSPAFLFLQLGEPLTLTPSSKTSFIMEVETN